MRLPAGLFLVATLHGTPVGCGALKFHRGRPTELKRMWVSPEVRGLGVARQLLDELERRAAEQGSRTIRLDEQDADGGDQRSTGQPAIGKSQLSTPNRTPTIGSRRDRESRNVRSGARLYRRAGQSGPRAKSPTSSALEDVLAQGVVAHRRGVVEQLGAVEHDADALAELVGSRRAEERVQVR